MRILVSRIIAILSLHRGSLAGWYQQACTAFAAVLTIPILNRTIGQSQTGVWLSFQSIAMLASLSDFGFGYVVARQIAFARAGRSVGTDIPDIDPEQVGETGMRNVLATARWLNLITASFATLTVLVGGGYYVYKQRISEVSATAQIIILVGLTVSISCTLLGKVDLAFLEGNGMTVATRVIAGSQSLLVAVCSTLAALLGFGLWGMAVAAMFISIGVLYIQRKRVSAILSSCSLQTVVPSMLTARRLIRTAVPMGVVNVGSYCFSAVQVPIVAAQISPSLATPFYLAQRCGQFAIQAALQFALPRLPTFSGYIGAGQHREAKNLMIRSICLVTATGFGAVTLFVVLFPWAVEVLFKSARLPSSVMLLMGLDYAALCASVVWGHFVLASGRNPFYIFTILSGVLNIGLLNILINHWGIHGVVASSLIAGLLTSYWACPFFGTKLLGILRK